MLTMFMNSLLLQSYSMDDLLIKKPWCPIIGLFLLAQEKTRKTFHLGNSHLSQTWKWNHCSFRLVPHLIYAPHKQNLLVHFKHHQPFWGLLSKPIQQVSKEVPLELRLHWFNHLEANNFWSILNLFKAKISEVL